MTFNLRDHIREVLASTDEGNIRTLSELVFDATPRQQIREAYRQALLENVRNELATAPRPDHQARDVHRTRVGAGSTSTIGEGQEPLDTQLARTSPGGGNVRNNRVARMRRARFRISVRWAHEQYKHILDCTADDLLFAAAESDRQAEANAATAARYRRLVKIMRQYDAETVAELTDEQIDEVLRDE